MRNKNTPLDIPCCFIWCSCESACEVHVCMCTCMRVRVCAGACVRSCANTHARIAHLHIALHTRAHSSWYRFFEAFNCLSKLTTRMMRPRWMMWNEQALTGHGESHLEANAELTSLHRIAIARHALIRHLCEEQKKNGTVSPESGKNIKLQADVYIC